MPVLCARLVRLTASQRHQLKKLARGHKSPHRDKLRARIVLTPNDFYDLADVEARLEAFQDHYNFAARPFNWRYTTKDLDELLNRLAAHNLPLPALA
jgi:hypothetical protein